MKIPFTSTHVYLGDPDKKLDEARGVASPSARAELPGNSPRPIVGNLFVGPKSRVRIMQIAELDSWSREGGTDGGDRMNAAHRIKECLKNSVMRKNLDINSLELTSLPNYLPSFLQRLRTNNNKLSAVPAEIGQLTKLTLLDHSDNHLTALPAEIGKLTKLKQLGLNHNQLTAVPAEIGQLSKLTELCLSHNQLTAVPAEIGQLSKLTELCLSHNQLTAVPAEIGQLTKLTELSLSFNQLTAVPKEIGQLTSLYKLDLGHNQLTAVPAEIGQLSKLNDLCLSHNQLTAVPAEIWQLDNLTSLDLGQNQLTAVPAKLRVWPNLFHLNLAGNQFTQVPRALFDFPQTAEIDMRGNPLPPEEIAAVRQELAQRRAAWRISPKFIFTEDIEINADNALQLAAQDDLNVHTGALTDIFKQSLDKLIAQFPNSFQGDFTQQVEEMRAIEQRLLGKEGVLKRYATGHRGMQSAISAATQMFKKAYGEQAEYVNDFQYTSGRVLSYVVLAMEAQWTNTPEADSNEAKNNGAKLLIDFMAAGKGFCDTRHIEEVLQMISLPLSKHAQVNPEVVGGVVAVAPTLDQVRDITFPVAQRILSEITQQQPELEGDELKNALQARVIETMRNDHPVITHEQVDAYLQNNILEHWDEFRENVG